VVVVKTENIKIVRVDDEGKEIGSPIIGIRASALALAQDFDWLLHNKGHIPGNFQKQTLELLAENVRPEILRLAIAMEMKLREHDDDRKDSWKDIPMEAAYSRAVDELNELIDAVQQGAPPEEVWREAGDAPNFVMFMAINYERLTREEE